MSAPLYEKLIRYGASGCYPFHMPGHKQGRGISFSPDFLKMDITEIDGFDNLHDAQGVIQEAQNFCAKTFGAEESFFLVNGSSCGLEAAILTLCPGGGKLIVARNCHKSVYHGLVLAGAEPIYLLPEELEEYGLAGGISPKKVQELLNIHPNLCGMVLTSPTFEGFTSDIKKIAEILHSQNKILIVDEAHGPHMKFHSFFPSTALEQGADVVIQSIHKTLPCLTQTALLHVQGKRIDRERLKEALAMVETTSPSYLFMGAIDLCREELDKRGQQKFNMYTQKLKKLRNSLSKLHSVRLLGKEVCGRAQIQDLDTGKLVFYLNLRDFSGVDFAKTLLKDYGISLEMAGLHHAVAMTTVADEEEGFQRLEKAVKEIDDVLKEMTPFSSQKWEQTTLPEQVYLPREAAFSVRESVLIEKSIGRVCAEMIVPYPPGIPLFVPGEKISRDNIERLWQYKESGISVIGLKDRTVREIQVLK